jgi:hypothetical protein
MSECLQNCTVHFLQPFTALIRFLPALFLLNFYIDSCQIAAVNCPKLAGDC